MTPTQPAQQPAPDAVEAMAREMAEKMAGSKLSDKLWRSMWEDRNSAPRWSISICATIAIRHIEAEQQQISHLKSALRDVQEAIKHEASDTLFMPKGISVNETVWDFIESVLEDDRGPELPLTQEPAP